MTLAINKKIIEYDTHNLKIHMEQCEKEICIQKKIINAIQVSYNFINGRIITSLTFLAIGIICVSLIV